MRRRRFIRNEWREGPLLAEFCLGFDRLLLAGLRL